MPALSRTARLYVAVVTGMAILCFSQGLKHWSFSGTASFALLLLLTIQSSLCKVVIPKVQGSLSMSYIFLMWGIVRMSLGETLLLGVAATLTQSFWKAKRKPHAVQLLFNLSVIFVSIGAAALSFHSPLSQSLLPPVLLRIVIAAFVYYLVNTFTVSGILSLTEGQPLLQVWRECYQWTLPHYLLSASLVGGLEFLRQYAGSEFALLILPVVYLIYHTFVLHIRALEQTIARAEQEKRHMEDTAGLHLRTIRALALAIEAKDQTTGEHLHRVQSYALELGADLGLSPAELEAVRAAAILHDIGKLAVPESIISKPGKLTPEEFARMKIHPVVGAEIIESVNFPYAVAPLVRAHHEKWDGTGYPDGLQGEEIPLGARILTAVDCLDALTSDRQYRKAIPLEKAMAMMVAESGKSFDPKIVELLRHRYPELEKSARTTLRENAFRLSTGLDVFRGKAPDAGYATGSLQGDQHLEIPAGELSRECALIEKMQAELGRSASLQDDLSAMEEDLRHLIPFAAWAVYRKRSEAISCSFAQGECAQMLRNLVIHLGTGISGWVAANRTPLLNGNAATEFGVSSPAHEDFTMVSGLAVPLESEYGPSCVLTLYSKEQEAFEPRHLRVLLALSSRLAYQIRIDASGGNRGTQLERLANSIQNSSPYRNNNGANSAKYFRQTV